KLNVRFDEGELETGYGCDIVTLTDERVRNCEHKLQPVATAPALYSTWALPNDQVQRLVRHYISCARMCPPMRARFATLPGYYCLCTISIPFLGVVH
ncbi:MAG: hypothetical protein ACUZ8E_13430, partial [Candidatus Anammoxibacter sp.]